jgi:alginate O-acetyltransferase complex protein AlgI
MVEKVILADHLASFVDSSLARYDTLSTFGTWLAVLGYTFQLYFDFCGYSDMAAGLGYMFGLRIPQNFNSPYKALDPADFWRRWHISLSTCLRDYLYIPLGGNRNGSVATYRNLMITMLIGGLWHGASWTFVFWGAYHGFLLSLHRRFGNSWTRIPSGLRQLATFLLVVVGWVFFRATDFGMATTLLTRMFIWTGGYLGADPGMALLFLSVAALWAMFGPNAFDLFEGFRWRPSHGYAAVAAMGWCITILAMGRNSPFLYFQF